ncbi:MAG: ABC transporter permease [Rhodothermales bacterium]
MLHSLSGDLPMLGNLIRTTLRHLKKHPGYAVLSMMGLSVGLGVCYLAIAYVRFETSYDTFHRDAERIYRVVTDIERSSGTVYASTSAPMAPFLASVAPEIEASVRVALDYIIVQRSPEQLAQEAIAYADPSLFDVFTLPFVAGDPVTALAAPRRIVLSETAAKAYFGTTACLGETLTLDGTTEVVVSGVMRDIAANSHLQVDYFVSMSTLLQEWNPSLAQNWKRFIFYTYVRVGQPVDAEAFGMRLTEALSGAFDQGEDRYVVSAEPLDRVYLYGRARGSRTGAVSTGDPDALNVLSIIAALVLVIASCNAINIATALGLRRVREIGVRKALGATPRRLVVQFLFEALMLAGASLVLAVVGARMLAPAFGQLIGKELPAGWLNDAGILMVLATIAALVGLGSGIYPALRLARTDVSNGLKGLTDRANPRSRLGGALVAVQFAVSAALIVATLAVYGQLHFMRDRPAGFDREGLIAVDAFFRLSGPDDLLAKRLARIEGVDGVSLSSAIPGKPDRQTEIEAERAGGGRVHVTMDAYYIDESFLGVYGLEMAAGRAFDSERPLERQRGLLVNEAATRMLGYDDPADAVGTSYVQAGAAGEIIGVVRDFYYHSLHDLVRPLAIRIAPGPYTYVTVRTSAGDLPAVLDALRGAWKEHIPDIPFLYFFVDDVYAAHYRSEAQWSRMTLWLAAIAILLSCLGLFGVAALGIARRTREISIRKVLGATVTGILALLARDQLLIVLGAAIVGALAARAAAGRWLEQYAYRTEVTWAMLALACGVSLLLALAALAYHTTRAARSDPATCLRQN